MPILHSLPRRYCRENRLLGIYYDGLNSHWGWAERTIGNCLSLAGLGTAWSETELRLLTDEIRATGISMRARRGVHRLLNPAGYPKAVNLLRNKARFAHHAAIHGLPTPATFDPGIDSLEDWLEARDAVIAKPGYSSKGEGIAAFRRKNDGWHGGLKRYTTAQLVHELNRCLSRHGVVQELIGAHPALAEISPGVLPTLRIVTCHDETGYPESCSVILRLGAGSDQPVDNFSSGGLAVRVDQSGRCAVAFRADGGIGQDIRDHPDSGAAIAGRPIPSIDDAIEIARSAHRTLDRGYRVVGWDIGLGSQGPTIIEGNWNPGTQIVQLVGATGLDRTRLGELYRFHLQRLLPEHWRQARAIEW